MPHRKFSCFVIGEGTLPIQCGGQLLVQGHQLLGVISPDMSVCDWAKEKAIPCTHPKEGLIKFLQQSPFDYLFSIVNRTILSREVLELPRRCAINYHDALLPKFAGVHATAWALMHQEKEHGITWHVMKERVDSGDILKQVVIPIGEAETTFTLNTKCYEAAIKSFSQLINELSLDQVVMAQQNLSDRSYFGYYERPSAGSVLLWNRDAHTLGALVRALDFGPYLNPLGIPKIIVGNDVFIVSELEVLDTPSNTLPGTIMAIEERFLKVSTASYNVTLSNIQTIEGQLLSITEFAKQAQFCTGYRLKTLTPDEAQRLGALYTLLTKHEKFWVEKLAQLQPISIPYAAPIHDFPETAAYAEVQVPLPDKVASVIANLSPTITSEEFLFAAFVTYLSRIGNTKCFDVGLSNVELQETSMCLKSLFATCLPCRIDIDHSHSFEDVLFTIRDQIALTRKHKTYSRDVVVRYPVLHAMPELTAKRIFPVALKSESTIAPSHKDLGTELTMVVSECENACYWIYNTSVFTEENITDMLRQFSIFVQAAATNIQQSVAQLPLLTENNKHKILSWSYSKASEYPKDMCLHHLFEAQAKQQPGAVAVCFEGQQLTYQEINENANRIAHLLQVHGVQPEVLVGICVERSLELIVGLLGILKAGGAYVPLDPNYPQERLKGILEDIQSPVLLTQQHLLSKFSASHTKCICLDQMDAMTSYKITNPVTTTTVENLAYVMYTSGSTGKPKGVLVEHRNVVALLYGFEHMAPSSKGRLVGTSVCPFSFDVSVWEIFSTLCFGGTLHILTPETSVLTQKFAKYLVQHRITSVYIPSALLSGVVEQLESMNNQVYLSRMLVGVEPIKQGVLQRFRNLSKNLQILNGYGPTETTICATFFRFGEATVPERPTPIGRPVPGYQVYLVDQSFQLVPSEVPGEILVGGEGLARGYLNAPALTKKNSYPVLLKKV